MPSNSHIVYGDKINPVYGFSMNKNLETDLNVDFDFHY